MYCLQINQNWSNAYTQWPWRVHDHKINKICYAWIHIKASWLIAFRVGSYGILFFWPSILFPVKAGAVAKFRCPVLSKQYTRDGRNY
nr:hypothetical protein CFP56_19844 [Quercus suber]